MSKFWPFFKILTTCSTFPLSAKITFPLRPFCQEHLFESAGTYTFPTLASRPQPHVNIATPFFQTKNLCPKKNICCSLIPWNNIVFCTAACGLQQGATRMETRMARWQHEKLTPKLGGWQCQSSILYWGDEVDTRSHRKNAAKLCLVRAPTKKYAENAMGRKIEEKKQKKYIAFFFAIAQLKTEVRKCKLRLAEMRWEIDVAELCQK